MQGELYGDDNVGF